MPYIIRTDDALGCVFIKWSGTFSQEQGVAFFRELAGNDSFQRGANLFHDARQANLNIPVAEMREVAKAPLAKADFAIEHKVALLASSDVAFGMLRILAATRGRPGLAIEVFRDLEEAKAWLGFPPDVGDPFERMRD